MKFPSSPNALSLRLWKSSLTLNWVHCTIFVKLIISLWKCTYDTFCCYEPNHSSGNVPVCISVVNDDITCLGGHFTLLAFPRLRIFPTQKLYMSERLSSCFSTATQAGVVQQDLYSGLRVKTVGTPRSFPIRYSHRDFSVTQLLTPFLYNFHFPHILTLGHR
jgi:hypothetical protein